MKRRHESHSHGGWINSLQFLQKSKTHGQLLGMIVVHILGDFLGLYCCRDISYRMMRQHRFVSWTLEEETSAPHRMMFHSDIRIAPQRRARSTLVEVMLPRVRLGQTNLETSVFTDSCRRSNPYALHEMPQTLTCKCLGRNLDST